jgi:hypothetical protein
LRDQRTIEVFCSDIRRLSIEAGNQNGRITISPADRRGEGTADAFSEDNDVDLFRLGMTCLCLGGGGVFAPWPSARIGLRWRRTNQREMIRMGVIVTNFDH